MKDVTKEIMAYSLQNSLEFGEARVDKVLPKLFQHGLDKKDIGKVIPAINLAVKKVNSMSASERKKNFEKFGEFVKEHVELEKALPELPGSAGRKKMVFRMAPFPSGTLHIGNAKTFTLNALYAEKYKGKLLLIMDDTIGSEEKQPLKESYKLIEEAFSLLKIKYSKPVIYKSDRLKIYYDYADKLIKKDKAYVCFCTQAEFKKLKDSGKECGCRNLPSKVQVERWKEMFKMDEGHAVLRLKTSMQHPNPAFRDRVLFKISDREHPRVGKKYRIWPTLEMSWSIDDHDLGVTHIIRGNELAMETEVEKYIWDIFNWKEAQVIHTGLVRLEGTIGKISKSKSTKEVKSGKYFGWDDPRTWSIQSLIKRGITPEAVKAFVEEIGLNKQDITIPIESLYATNRKIVDMESDRYSFIIDPVKLSWKNSLKIKEIEVPTHPDRKETRKTRIKSLYISKADFKKFFGKEIRLLHLFNMKIGKECEITSVENKKIPKINWVSENEKAKVLMPDGSWIEGIIDKAIYRVKVGDIIQLERFGFVRYQGKRSGIYTFWFAHN